MKCHQHIYILARSPALLLWILFHHMEKCWQVAHTVADHSLDTCLQLASALHCTLVPWNYRNFKEMVETMHVASRQRMVSEFMTIYTKKPWPTMPELPTVLFCWAMMEKGSAVLEVVFRSNVQATTWRSNGWSNGWSRRFDLLGLHTTPLAAAVAEANASVFSAWSSSCKSIHLSTAWHSQTICGMSLERLQLLLFVREHSKEYTATDSAFLSKQQKELPVHEICQVRQRSQS